MGREFGPRRAERSLTVAVPIAEVVDRRGDVGLEEPAEQVELGEVGVARGGGEVGPGDGGGEVGLEEGVVGGGQMGQDGGHMGSVRIMVGLSIGF